MCFTQPCYVVPNQAKGARRGYVWGTVGDPVSKRSTHTCSRQLSRLVCCTLVSKSKHNNKRTCYSNTQLQVTTTPSLPLSLQPTMLFSLLLHRACCTLNLHLGAGLLPRQALVQYPSYLHLQHTTGSGYQLYKPPTLPVVFAAILAITPGLFHPSCTGKGTMKDDFCEPRRARTC